MPRTFLLTGKSSVIWETLTGQFTTIGGEEISSVQKKGECQSEMRLGISQCPAPPNTSITLGVSVPANEAGLGVTIFEQDQDAKKIPAPTPPQPTSS